MGRAREDSSHSSGRALASADWLEAHETAKSEFRDTVVARWRLAAGARVVDIGCGAGFWTRRIANAVGPRGKVTGIDVAEDLIEVARARNRDLIDANICDFRACSIDVLDESDLTSTDVVIVLNVLGYLASPSITLARIWRQLRPGARLIIRQYDYGCTMYSRIGHDLQLRMLSALGNALALKPLEPPCDPFLGRELPSVLHDAGIQKPQLTSDAVQLVAPFSVGAERYLREKGLWIGEHALQASLEDASAWDRHFDPSDSQYVLSKPDAFFVTLEIQAEVLK